MRERGRCLEKNIIQVTLPGVRRSGLSWVDNINSRTSLGLVDALITAKDRVSGARQVHGVANPRIEEVTPGKLSFW